MKKHAILALIFISLVLFNASPPSPKSPPQTLRPPKTFAAPKPRFQELASGLIGMQIS